MSRTILNETLQDFNYYLNKLPLYLKNDTAFHSHFRIWYDFLVASKIEKSDDNPESNVEPSGLIMNSNGVVGTADALFCLLNIFDDNYLSLYTNETMSDVLDKLGELFGVTRKFTISYVDDKQKTETLNLSNQLFLYLIKGQIIKNYCDGTYNQIKEHYRSIGLDVAIVTTGSATVTLYKNSSAAEINDFDKLFLSGLLTIENMGIAYSYVIVNFDLILTWSDVNDGTKYSPTSTKVKTTECWYQPTDINTAAYGGFWA